MSVSGNPVRTIVGGAAAAALAAVVLACGGGSSTSPSSNITCSSLPNATTILILNNAVCPTSLTVTRGTRVTFINNDSRPHDMASNPHPEHTDCPAINDVGFLQAGQTRQTGNLTVARTCGFHDHDQPTNTALQGSIVTQ